MLNLNQLKYLTGKDKSIITGSKEEAIRKWFYEVLPTKKILAWVIVEETELKSIKDCPVVGLYYEYIFKRSLINKTTKDTVVHPMDSNSATFKLIRMSTNHYLYSDRIDYQLKINRFYDERFLSYQMLANNNAFLGNKQVVKAIKESGVILDSFAEFQKFARKDAQARRKDYKKKKFWDN